VMSGVADEPVEVVAEGAAPAVVPFTVPDFQQARTGEPSLQSAAETTTNSWVVAATGSLLAGSVLIVAGVTRRARLRRR
jgi:MFS superfamily sulfate permease-like transporter